MGFREKKRALSGVALAALRADVAGYSRLMSADEEATIETLTAYRKVFTSEKKKHRGRVVDAKGGCLPGRFPGKSGTESLARFEHQVERRFGRAAKTLESGLQKDIAQPFLSRLRTQAEPNFLG